MPEQDTLEECRFYNTYNEDDKRITNFYGGVYCSMSSASIEGNVKKYEKVCEHQAEKLGRIEGDNPPFWRCSIAPLLENCDSELIEEDVLKDS